MGRSIVIGDRILESNEMKIKNRICDGNTEIFDAPFHGAEILYPCIRFHKQLPIWHQYMMVARLWLGMVAFPTTRRFAPFHKTPPHTYPTQRNSINSTQGKSDICDVVENIRWERQRHRWCENWLKIFKKGFTFMCNFCIQCF